MDPMTREEIYWHRERLMHDGGYGEDHINVRVCTTALAHLDRAEALSEAVDALIAERDEYHEELEKLRVQMGVDFICNCPLGEEKVHRIEPDGLPPDEYTAGGPDNE